MLVVTLYEDDKGQDRFKVYWAEGEGEAEDITEQYEVAAVATEDGRRGFTVIKKEPEDGQ